MIDETGQQLGVLPVRDALRIARERNLDLVEVAPGAAPPVARLLNYGKYIYEQTKKAREAKKARKMTEIKEIRLRPKIGEHDIEFKTKHIRDFLAEGAKVQVTVPFRGRERSHPELGQELLKRVIGDVADVAVVERPPTVEEGARSVFALLAPKPE